MGKNAEKVKKLKKKIKKLRKKIAKNSISNVSPLAPKAGFPTLAIIKGVKFSAACTGIKYKDRNDVMLIEIASGSSIAGVFTRSSTRSAPVLDCQKKLAKTLSKDHPIAILVNSGNANAFTGSAGDTSVQAITLAVAKTMNTKVECVFTASTGVIGEPLEHKYIIKTVQNLKDNLSSNNAKMAAQAIMTTDTFPKGSTATIMLGDTPVHITGFAKGSGMIAPDMATMLVYIFTDAAIAPKTLQTILSNLNKTTFNAITVDNDTSTSDSLMLVATGKSNAKLITDTNTKQAKIFIEALHKIMLDLSHLVVKDGEGARKFISVNITGAINDASAKTIAFSIANSPLVKTAVAGEDPNWGRIVMAIGKSGEPADRDKLAIYFGNILVAENGMVAQSYSEQAGADYMKNSDINISANIGVGQGSACVWTCDLTHQYITINADYRS